MVNTRIGTKKIFDYAVLAAAGGAFLTLLFFVVVPAEQAPPRKPINIESDNLVVDFPRHSIGSAAAPDVVVLIEVSDFECPYCKQFSRDVYPVVKQRLIDTQRVAYGFNHLPLLSLHPNAFTAAQMAECAGAQSRFWPMHEWLFAQDSPLNNLETRAPFEQLGLNRTQLSSCLEQQSATVVRRDIGTAGRLKITSTPTLLLGRFTDAGQVSLKWKFVGVADADEVVATVAGLAPKVGRAGALTPVEHLLVRIGGRD